MTVIALDEPTESFGALFTKNAFPGAPIIIGRKRLQEASLGAIVVNNKIANVCAPGGVEAARQVCASTATALGISDRQVLPSSTGVIGWSLPVQSMVNTLPTAIQNLQAESALPAAEGIVTTDLYPKVRRADVGGGSIVGFAKGAGMLEPNLATMLVYILTDIAIPRETLRESLSAAVAESFNLISIDSDTSTSDTVAIASSGKVTGVEQDVFNFALRQVCQDLAEDVVRNGEGVRHVIRVKVAGAPDRPTAMGLGKAVVNAPLFKCAIAGNDANVGRLVQAIGKYIGAGTVPIDLSSTRIEIGGIEIFAEGTFRLDPTKEDALTEHLTQAELYTSEPTAEGAYLPPVSYPPHERCVELSIDLGLGDAHATILGGDLTHEYVTENADYRS